jgi:CRISPR/Cas system-associated exonuclease Cas4 (RecB family)
MGAAARIGTAMHKALQSLTESPVQAAELSSIAAEAERRFKHELATQKAEAAENKRETSLLWDTNRIYRAQEAVIAEAIRNQGLPRVRWQSRGRNKPSSNQAGFVNNIPEELPACEVGVQSRDGMFRGRIDRVEAGENGIRLIDYKSAYRDDLPGRYTRQIQLYAFLWYEMSGEWPSDGQVYYPMKGTFYSVQIEENICKQVVIEAQELIKQLDERKSAFELSKPGDTCKVCEYRPWCKAFWNWQNSEKVLIKAKEKAARGFEGELANCSLVEHYWRLVVKWNNIQVRIIVPQERFPHLVQAKAGQTVRVLDAPLKGVLNQPTIQVYDTTEIFLVE